MAQKEKKKEGTFGFTNAAEIWNGRLAMIGFLSAIYLEMNTGHGVLKQFGILNLLR
ncbi:MAG: chlorophyll a/b-binding protein [Cyanobacteria bacterium J06621_8]